MMSITIGLISFAARNTQQVLWAYALGFSLIGLNSLKHLFRELNNPGHNAAVQKNDLGGKYIEVLEGHEFEFWYYYNNFIDFKYQHGIYSFHAVRPQGFLSKTNKSTE